MSSLADAIREATQKVAGKIRGDGNTVTKGPLNLEEFAEYRNLKRYNWKTTVSEADDFGCVWVTLDWDEDYEVKLCIGCVVLTPAGTTRDEFYTMGWYAVRGEHHHVRERECPGQQAYASRTEVTMNGEVVWSAAGRARVEVTSGGTCVLLQELEPGVAAERQGRQK